MTFSVMLAKSYDPQRISNWEYITMEPKLDGIRVIIMVHPDKSVTYQSRNGRLLDMFSHLDAAANRLARRLAKRDGTYKSGAALDGEMVSESAKFADISGAIHRKNHTADYARFHCFHVMPMSDFYKGIDAVSQLQRMHQLKQCVDNSRDLIRYRAPIFVESDSAVQQYYARLRKSGYEGAMVKRVALPWAGKRSDGWLKMKPTETEDVLVTSIKPGKGKYKGTIGALVCNRVLKDGKLGARVQVSGMTDKQRDEWQEHPNRILQKMIEVEFHEPTESTKLRHPRFKCLRGDKQGESSK